MSISRSIRDRAWALSAVASGALAGALLLVATPAGAHGFGERYELPLPLSFFLFGAAAAVALSFLVFSLFVRPRPAGRAYPQLDLYAHRLGRLIAHPAIVLALRAGTLGLFVLTVWAGLAGDQNPYRNLAPTLVWVIWWVGLAYVSAFVGNVWMLINPWRTAFDAADWLYRRVGRRPQLAFRLRYPPAVGVWPACVLLLAFAWIELVYPSPAVPAHIAWLALAYSALTWAGMLAFGRETWLRHGEVFTLVFGTFSRFAPTEVRVSAPAVCAACEAACRTADASCTDCCDCFRRAAPQERQWLLRPFGAGLSDARAVSTSMTAFVLLLLSTVLFDGFLTTPGWSEIESRAAALFASLGDHGGTLVRSLGLLAFWLVFLGAYAAICALMSLAAAGARSPLDLARDFVLTLVPIAIGYHVAHYLVFLLVQGQYVVPLASDPFGYGWDLFGSAGYRADIGIVGARFSWYVAVAAIVLGHVAAVYLAHVKALGTIAVPRLALRSQIPLTALMVAYTFTGLSIIAEPIVERTAPAEPTAVVAATVDVPAEALRPQPGSGRLQGVAPGTSARAKLTYRVLGSAFHDGTRTSPADLVYAYAFAFRWGERGEADDSHVDPFVAAATAALRRHLVGVRVVGADSASKSFRVADVTFIRELFTVEVYLAAAPAEPEQDAGMTAPWTTVPWHLLALMEEAVSRGVAAFSQGEAARRGVPWLDLVRSEPVKDRLAMLVAEFQRDGFRPAALEALVDAEEARRRWAALAAFYRTHRHFLVTNGPYRLKEWAAERVTLEAFRDLTYPLGVGSYDSYAVPRRGYVTAMAQDGSRVTVSGDIETIEKFQRSYRLVRTPLRTMAPDMRRRAAPECRYVVTDDRGRVVLAGAARIGDGPAFEIDLKDRLPAGTYTLSAAIAVGGNLTNADIRRLLLTIPPDG